jgi:hypothetical protein
MTQTNPFKIGGMESTDNPGSVAKGIAACVSISGCIRCFACSNTVEDNDNSTFDIGHSFYLVSLAT